MPECSYLTAGTALVGAGAIALSPITPTPTAVRDLHVPAVVSSLGVELAAAPNPFDAWYDTINNAVSNLYLVGQGIWAMPAPLPRQVLANLINYAGMDIGAYQNAAAGAVSFFGGTGNATFQFYMGKVTAQLEAGDISGAMNSLFSLTGLFITMAQTVFLPMETALDIPKLIVANVSHVVNYVLSYSQFNPFGLIAALGSVVLTGMLNPVGNALAIDLQAAYSSAVAGDWLGTVASLVDLPGQLTNAILNGNGTGGLLGASDFVVGPGLLGVLTLLLPQQLATAIVTPGGQNIVAGGSVLAAMQHFFTQLTTGWPTPSQWASIPTGIAAGLKGFPQAVVGVIARALQGLLGGVIPGGAAAVTPAGAASADSHPAARSVTPSVSLSAGSSEGAESPLSGVDAGSATRTDAAAGSARTPAQDTTSTDSADSAGESATQGGPASGDTSPGDSSAAVESSSTSESTTTHGAAASNTRSDSAGASSHRSSVSHHRGTGGSARHAHSGSSN